MKSHSNFGKKNSLTLLTCVTACLAFIMLCVSISTDNWLSTFERDSDDNGTTVTAIHSGLWRQCKQSQYLPGITKKTTWNENMKTFPANELVNCSYIKYFKGKQGGLAEIKPPEAILYDMQPAAFFPTTGLLGLLTGCILSFLSYCDQKVKKLIFVGGGLFVLSGIFMLVGIVLYVGSISQAFDSTAGKMDSEEKYVYDYGGSFYFSVVSFILTEFSGVFAIYLYIAKHHHYLRIKREKVLARSQSVNSCVGLVPSVSRFSFETPQEQLVNSADLTYSLKKPDRDISNSTTVEWCELNHHGNHNSQAQWLSSNGNSKLAMSATELHQKSHFNLPPNRAAKPVVMTACEDYTVSRPITMFYEEELGETSFGYNPSNDTRIFYDNAATTYYLDNPHVSDGRHGMMMSPARGVLTTLVSPRHGQYGDTYSSHRMLTSPDDQLRNYHILTSHIDDEKLGNHCNCAQMEMANHLPTQCPPHIAAVLPQNATSAGVSSRKITSV